MTPAPKTPWTWFHIVLTTYGSWLPGDERGFRTRHHQYHVAGDYLSPPASAHPLRRDRSRNLLKQLPVSLSPRWRSLVGSSLIDRLDALGAIVLDIAVSSQHVHLLAKLPPGDARHWIGLAKKHTTFALRKLNWEGRLWGTRGKLVRVRTRQQQLNTFRYILKHKREGAWVRHFVTSRGKRND